MKVYICYYTNDYVNDSNSKVDTDDIEYDYEERDVIE